MRTLPVFFVVGLLGLMVQSALASYSDVLIHQAERIEDRWVSDSNNYSTEAYARAISHLKKAKFVNSGNPDIRQMKGRLTSWHATNAENRALDQLKTAIHKRPYWPYAYSDYAGLVSLGLYQAYDQEAEFGDGLEQELNSAWENALKYGSNEPQIVENLLNIGFANWHVSSWNIKQKTIELFQKSMDSNAVIQRKAISSARFYNHSEVLCRVYQLGGDVPRLLAKECRKFNKMNTNSK